jgi:hypothetical protein
MRPVDHALATRVARRLTVAIAARTMEDTDYLINRLFLWARRSWRKVDATFRAIQILRDLDMIDRAEAAYLFAELLDHLPRKDTQEARDQLAAAVTGGVEYELIVAAMRDKDRRHAELFHRERGEDELAEMIVEQPDAHATLCAEGAVSLLHEKPSDSPPLPDTKAVIPHDLAEHVLALSATETLKEWVPAWHALCRSLRDAEPSAAVATIQSMRDVGAISFNESVVLIDMAISTPVFDALQGDREYRRLERALETFLREHGIDEGDGASDEARPLEWQVLEQRRIRRLHGITALVLRQFGEHRLASLIATDPEEYKRLRDDLVGGLVE